MRNFRSPVGVVTIGLKLGLDKENPAAHPTEEVPY